MDLLSAKCLTYTLTRASIFRQEHGRQFLPKPPSYVELLANNMKPHRHDNFPLLRRIAIFSVWPAWLWVSHLVVLSVVAFVSIRSRESNQLLAVAEIMTSNDILVYGVTAFVLAGILRLFMPLTIFFAPLWELSRPRFDRFRRGLFVGTTIAVSFLLAATISGQISYLGFFIQIDELAGSFTASLLFSIAFIGFSLFEEFIFRRVLDCNSFQKPKFLLVGTLVWVILKHFQFGLTPVTALNFVVLNLVLVNAYERDQSFHFSGGILAGWHIVTHVLTGLPFLGRDIPSIVLFRAQGAGESGANFISTLSGGETGPEGSVALTILLLITLWIPRIRNSRPQPN